MFPSYDQYTSLDFMLILSVLISKFTTVPVRYLVHMSQKKNVRKVQGSTKKAYTSQVLTVWDFAQKVVMYIGIIPLV